jgi:hypothetical protein
MPTAFEQLVAISIGFSVFGFVVLGVLTYLCLREVRVVANIQRAIFLRLRQDGIDVRAELAAIKELLEE